MWTRHLPPFAAAALFCAGAALPQTPASTPAFEVATIKPAPPLNPQTILQGKMHIGMKVDAARVDIGFMSIADLIRTAYEVKDFQVSGPDWIRAERFDILAKLPEGATKEQVPAMLKTLLAERFKLTVHKENREHAVYALMAGKNGPSMKPAAADAPGPAPNVAPDAAGKGGMTIETNEGTMRVNRGPNGGSATITNAKGGAAKVTMGQDGMMHMDLSKISMHDFAEALSRYVDRPVVDETGLKGDYQVSLDISVQDLMRAARSAGMNVPGMMPAAAAGGSAADAASDPGGSSVFAAVQRLGLKLDPRKEPVETIVVDHVEKTPTEN